MASTITLSNTINWALPFLSYAPVTIGASSEPAITSANTILQTILSPPFAWRWNRKTLTFPTVIGQQDYTVSSSDFGFFEIADIAIAGSQTFPLENKYVLSGATEKSRPEFIAIQNDDAVSSLTFRLLPVPDKIYTVTVTYQIRPVPFTAIGDDWSPIPDGYQFIYNWGFLSMMEQYTKSSDPARSRQLFVAGLLGVSEGLLEEERNLFISSWLGETRQVQAQQLNTQSGWRGRTI